MAWFWMSGLDNEKGMKVTSFLAILTDRIRPEFSRILFDYVDLLPKPIRFLYLALGGLLSE